MAGEYRSFKRVLSTINDKKGLNKDNIIEELKTELEKQDQDLYEEWKKGGFDVNHLFSLRINGRKYLKLPLLIVAAEYGYEQTVKALIQAGADVDVVDEYNNTPLHCIAIHFLILDNHEKIVEALIQAGADVNKVDRLKNTALQYAFFAGRKEIAKILIQAGAHVNAVDKDCKLKM